MKDTQDHKEKLQALYDELKKEVDGTISPTGVYLPPCAYSYYRKANALIDEAKKYAELDKNFVMDPVLHTFDKEVSYVRDYEGKGKTAKKRKEEIDSLMRKATHQLYLDLCPLIKE